MTGIRLWLFLAVAIGITIIGATYLVRRLAVQSTLPRWIRRLILGHLVLGAALMMIAPPLYRASSDPHHSTWVTAVQWASFLMMGYLATLVFIVMLKDVSHLARITWCRLKKQSAPDLGRRRWVQNSFVWGATGTAAVTSGAGLAQVLKGPKVDRINVTIRNLPPSFEGYTIAQLSDVHIGPTLTKDFSLQLVKMTNDLNPDLIALTGDFVDGQVDQIGAAVDPFAELQSKDGVFFCTGNHEYYSGVENWMEKWRSLGVTVLENEHRVVRRGKEELVIAGVHDHRSNTAHPSHRDDPKQALNGAPETTRILLAHQPRSVFEAANEGIDLQISGHTHARQFFPFSMFVFLAQPYVSGLSQHDARTQIYVNRGTGYWGPPHRFAVPGEISLIRLTSA
jgi:predicted MPP superfamily phosphohydrolase